MKLRLEAPSQRPADDWPAPAAPEAFAGPLGEYVDALMPHTEGDPHAILVSGLTIFGNVVSREPHWLASQTAHHLNLFTVLVGPTAGRKGMSHDVSEALFRGVDPEWPLPCHGLTSGEGLIHAVRDAKPIASARSTNAKPSKGRPVERRNQDPGVTDKRLLVVESEFGATLRVMARDSSTLSAVLRRAWDGDSLQTLGKREPERATDPHVSIIGHITVEELHQYLDDTNLLNGFANRFLWVCTKRSKELPEGGTFTSQQMLPFQMRMTKSVRFARKVRLMRRSARAKRLWADIYSNLTAERPGLIGKVTLRRAPLVMRLACLYALLDRQDEVQEKHLRSALAIWDYCDASARYIFGERAGQKDADVILDALRRNNGVGLSRNDIFRKLFQGHRSQQEIEAALMTLHDIGMARSEKQPTKGRPVERWYAVNGYRHA